MNQKANAVPPRTTLTVQVGVTGHRALPLADMGLLHAAISSILQEIEQTAAGVAVSTADCYAPGAPVLRMISMLAEGADQVAAQAALAQGWRLQSVLPMERAQYEQTMEADAGRAEFRRLLGEATTVFEIACPSQPDSRAYQNGGQVMLGHCDFLLAVWNGQDSGRVGGTGDTVDEAIRQDIPVLCVDSIAPHGIRLLYAGRAEADWRTAVRRELTRMLVPTGAGEGDGFPALFLRENSCGKHRGGLYSRFVRLLASARAYEERKAEPAKDAFYAEHYARYFACADALAGRYGDIYRSAGILRQVLPFLASVGLALGFYSVLFAGPAGPVGSAVSVINVLSAAGFALQALCFVAVIAFARLQKKRQWQRRFIEYRVLAETLRQMEYLACAGLVVRGARPPAFSNEPSAPWVHWYFRAVARQAGLPACTLTQASLCRAAQNLSAGVLAGQIRYHRANARGMGRVAARLERVGIAVYYAGIAVVALRAVWFYLVTGGGLQAFVNAKFSSTFFNMLSMVVPLFPALALGISSQEGFGRIRMRSDAMAGALEAAAAQADAAHCADFNAYMRAARAAAKLMLSEFSDWSAFIREKTIGDH